MFLTSKTGKGEDKYVKDQEDEMDRRISYSGAGRRSDGHSDGLLALVNGNPDTYIKKVFSTKTSYKTPEELTETQRAFYDSYVEKMEVYASEMTFTGSNDRLISVMIIAPAISLNHQKMEWYTENGIMEYETEYRFGKDRADGLVDAMSGILSLLEDGTEYAEKNIE